MGKRSEVRAKLSRARRITRANKFAHATRGHRERTRQNIHDTALASSRIVLIDFKGETIINTHTSSSPSGFALASREPRIAPSLLAADFSRLEEAVTAVESAGATVLHLDVMDGHFVPNISFGPPVIASLRKRSALFFDAHLMIAEPRRYAEGFVKSGCDHITFHIEATEEPRAVVRHIRDLGASVGIALNPATPVSAIEPILDEVDLVLVMSVWPGFGGQTFLHDVLPKLEQLRSRLRDDQRLEIDGGVDATTIGSAAAAGADLFVAGTAVFREPDPPAALRRLRAMAVNATATHDV